MWSTKISSNAASALKECRVFRSGDTVVRHYRCTNTAAMYLYGSVIACYDSIAKVLELRDASWLTATTKARLNAILAEFELPYSISKQKDKWYISNTDTGIQELWEGVKVFLVP